MHKIKQGIVLLLFFAAIELIKISLLESYAGKMPKDQLLIKLQQAVDFDRIIEKKAADTYEIGASYSQWKAIGEEQQKALIIAADSCYDSYEQLPFVSGGFFTAGQVEAGSNVAIVSSQLALRLFGTVKAVGNWCDIDHQPYCIIGVYKPLADFTSFLKSDGRDPVYIPLTSTVADNWQADCLQCWKKDENTLSNLLAAYQLDEGTIDVYEGSRIKAVLQTWCLLPWLVLEIFLLREAVGCSWKRQKKAWLLWGMFGLAGLLLKRHFYVWPQAIPTDNLLSAEPYLNYFIKSSQQFNALREDFPGSWLSIEDKVRNCLLMLGSLQIILEGKTLIIARQLEAEQNKSKRMTSKQATNEGDCVILKKQRFMQS